MLFFRISSWQKTPERSESKILIRFISVSLARLKSLAAGHTRAIYHSLPMTDKKLNRQKVVLFFLILTSILQCCCLKICFVFADWLDETTRSRLLLSHWPGELPPLSDALPISPTRPLPPSGPAPQCQVAPLPHRPPPCRSPPSYP